MTRRQVVVSGPSVGPEVGVVLRSLTSVTSELLLPFKRQNNDILFCVSEPNVRRRYKRSVKRDMYDELKRH